MEQKRIVHRRLICNTEPFLKALTEFGFKLVGLERHGLETIRKFTKGEKHVHSSHQGMVIFTMNGRREKMVVHNGLSIDYEMLKFFATRELIDIKRDKN